jgi:hypothetical protein
MSASERDAPGAGIDAVVDQTEFYQRQGAGRLQAIQFAVDDWMAALDEN